MARSWRPAIIRVDPGLRRTATSTASIGPVYVHPLR